MRKALQHCRGPNDCQYHVPASVRYMVLQLSEKCGTTILVILQASTVLQPVGRFVGLHSLGVAGVPEDSYGAICLGLEPRVRGLPVCTRFGSINT